MGIHILLEHYPSKNKYLCPFLVAAYGAREGVGVEQKNKANKGE